MLLEIKNLHFSYDNQSSLFQNFNLNIEEGKIIALAGESGCGKSTLLKLIYGNLQWTEGDILFNGRKLLGPKGNLVPGEPDMKWVAQDYDLMPYAKVSENVGHFISNINLREKKEKVTELLDVVDMSEFAAVLPKYLSGGQKQRVAIARALSITPKLLLLDEPFSNLDASRRLKLRDKFFQYVKKEKLTLIISTHDVHEIMPWVDEMIVLENGQLQQIATPELVYHEPKNAYVAQLFGEVNILNDEEMLHLQHHKFFIYPQNIKMTNNGLPAFVLESRFSGSYYWNKILYKGKELIMYSPHKLEGNISIELS